MSLEVNKLKKGLGDFGLGCFFDYGKMECFGVKYSIVHFHCSLKLNLF